MPGAVSFTTQKTVRMVLSEGNWSEDSPLAGKRTTGWPLSSEVSKVGVPARTVALRALVEESFQVVSVAPSARPVMASALSQRARPLRLLGAAVAVAEGFPQKARMLVLAVSDGTFTQTRLVPAGSHFSIS